MRYIARLALFVALFGSGSCVTACTGTPSEPEAERDGCAKAESRRAVCEVGEKQCEGREYCRGNPGEWICECEPEPLKETSVGQSCKANSDCGDGGRCLRSEATDLLGGGPASAVCVLDCTGDVSVCEGHAKDLVCVQTGGQTDEAGSGDQAYCFESCEIGDSPKGGTEKCGGRPAFACDEQGGGMGQQGAEGAFCRPLCFTDEDCGSGFCDRAFGVCTQTARKGAPLGEPCSSGGEECAGLCLNESGLRYCSQRCVLGTPGQCGDGGFCGALGSRDSASGDAGFCQQACDCDADCEHPDAVCVSDSLSQQLTGKVGVCVAAQLAPDSGTLRCSAPDAGLVPDAGAMKDAGTTKDAASSSAEAGAKSTLRTAVRARNLIQAIHAATR